MNTKKIVLPGFVIIAFLLYSTVLRHDDTTPVVSKATTPVSTAGSLTTTTSSGATAGAGSSQQSSAKYKDGTYTGSVADAYYGNIQVSTTIQGGKITDVEFLQYPNDRPNSVQINTQAMPLLKQEAIQAQSAQVDGVTGATDTSQAFVQSLTAALTKAQA